MPVRIKVFQLLWNPDFLLSGPPFLQTGMWLELNIYSNALFQNKSVLSIWISHYQNRCRHSGRCGGVILILMQNDWYLVTKRQNLQWLTTTGNELFTLINFCIKHIKLHLNCWSKIRRKTLAELYLRNLRSCKKKAWKIKFRL